MATTRKGERRRKREHKLREVGSCFRVNGPCDIVLLRKGANGGQVRVMAVPVEKFDGEKEISSDKEALRLPG